MDRQRSKIIWSFIASILAIMFILFLLIINRQRNVALALTEAHRKQLEDQTHELIESNITKNTLLDILSHDLKNKAGSIRGLSEVLLEEFPTNKYIAAIEKDSEKLIDVIAQTATLTELQEGNPIIESIFRNFIQNAIKYAHSGHKIRIGTEDKEIGLKIYVADNGDTIPKEQRVEIFQRKAQLNPKENRGSGLGLAISKRIAEAHHAEIGVEPHKPSGNSFYIILPQKARFQS